MKVLINKDHQRMMVDPMFMIVQNLRSFLTAVTPTAVKPTAVTPTAVTPTDVTPTAVIPTAVVLPKFT